MRYPIATLVVLAGFGAVACGPDNDAFVDADDAVGAEDAILAGETDDDTVAVVGVLAGGDELCTGFFLMPDLVVTARHCAAILENANAGCFAETPATASEALAASEFTIDGKTNVDFVDVVAFDAVVLVGDDELCGNDIALLQLAAPVDGVVPLVPRIDGPPVVDEAISVVGYGDGASAGAIGVRRRRDDATVQSVGENREATSDFLDTSDGEWVASFGPCGGDSGGPALDADGLVIGVMSRGNQQSCTAMIYERVDVHADFLREQAVASAERLGIDVPAWAVVAEEEPAGCPGCAGAPAALPAALLVLRRRRRR